MAGNGMVGPACSTKGGKIDPGTLCRSSSATPGPIGKTTPPQPAAKKRHDVYEIQVSGKRETEGYNDFRMVLKKNGSDVAGYSFIVGRDVASGHTSYSGTARLSTRQVSRKEMRAAMGPRQSNIEGGNGAAIHSGRSSHRHITFGCVRMDESDFNKLFDYLEKENAGDVDKWFWFKHVSIHAEPIATPPNPKFRVPQKGNQQ